KALVGNRDDAALIGDDILHAEFTLGHGDLGASLGFILGLEFEHLVLNEREQDAFIFENIAQLGDGLLQLLVLGFDFTTLNAGELIEAKVKNGVGLTRGERETL